MKLQWPHIAVTLIILIGAMSWYQGKKTDNRLLKIERELGRSEMREEQHLQQIERLIIQAKAIATETIPINKKHDEIRSHPITDPIRDSLVRSIIERGKARFD